MFVYELLIAGVRLRFSAEDAFALGEIDLRGNVYVIVSSVLDRFTR